MVRTAAGGIALVAGAEWWLPGVAGAAPTGTPPKPIPGGLDLFQLLGLGHGPTFHTFFPAFGQEVSTIADFNGSVAAAEIQGTGIATDTVTHATSMLYYDADMRFMDGTYVGEDGHIHPGTFGFV
jgi:hypothetical protein